MNSQQSQPKVVVITGASSGIGEATALEFARKGWSLVLAARSVDKLNKVADNCRAMGSKVHVAKCDVSIEEDCKRLIAETLSVYGTFHVLVNNAGISMRAMFNEADLGVIKQVMDINFWGAVYCTKYALPELLKNKGSVITVSSVSGLVGLPARTGYSASKYALNGFMQSLRIENLHNGLHVGIVYPGYTSSNIRNAALNKDGIQQSESPLDESKLMPASKVGQTILWMVNTRRRQRILTTQGHLVNFLNAFVPSWIDRMVYKFVSKEKDSPFS